MNVFHAGLLIAKKDLVLSLRDRTGMALGFGLPIVLVLAFGFIYQMTFGSPGGMSRTGLAVADLDRSTESEALVAAMRDGPLLAIHPRKGEPALDEADLRRRIEDGESHHGLVIAPGFGSAIAAGKLPPLRLLRDPGRDLESQMVSIGLLQAVMSTNGIDLAPAITTQAMLRAGLPPGQAEQMSAMAKHFSAAIETLFSQASESDGEPGGAAARNGDGGTTREKPAAKSGSGADIGSIFQDLVPVEKVDIVPPARPKQLDYMMSHNLAGIAQMMLMFGLVACGTMLLQERDSGTLRRLLLAPVSSNAVLLGKFLFTAAMGAMQLVVLFVVSSLVFDVNVLRDPLTLVVLSAALLFAITSFGIVIAALARSQKQAEGLATLLILLMSALGGAWFPLERFDLPPVGEAVMHCTLTYWAMHSFQGMLYYGKDLSDAGLLRDIAVLVGFGIVATFVATRAFKSRFVG